MSRFSKILSFALVTLLVSANALAESFPSDDAAQRAKIESLLDKEIGTRRSERPATSGRRGYRYNAETGYAADNKPPSRDYSADARRNERARTFADPYRSNEKSPVRAFSGDSPAETMVGGAAPEEAAPARKQRWRVEGEIWNSPAPKAKTEAPSNYPFDSQDRAPAGDFAAAFDNGNKPKGNKSRQALLNVKKWMNTEDEKAARATAENEDDFPSVHDYNARIGLLGGMSSLNSSTATTEAAPANLFLGLFTDAHFGQYFGAEVEGFYGIAPKIQEVDVNSAGVTTSDTTRSVQHMGGMLDLKVRYAIPFGSVSVVPKFGLGYGFVSLTANASSASGESSLKQAVSGLYWMTGVDIIPSDSFSLGIDYSASLSASGSATEDKGGTVTSQAIEGAAYNRLRIGAYVRVLTKVSLGAQFILRNLTAGSAGAASVNGTLSKSNEGLSQMLGVLMFQL